MVSVFKIVFVYNVVYFVADYLHFREGIEARCMLLFSAE